MMKTPQQAPPRPPGPRLPSIIGWLTLIGLLVWNMVAFWPNPQPEVPLPYSTFLAQVRAGNVTEVRIVGDRITGTFAKPLRWPAAAMESAPKPPPTSLPGAAPGQAPPAAYERFTTTFPQAVGDASLMPLLEAHKVVVNVTAPSTPWFMVLLSDGLPLLLGYFVWMGRQAARSQVGLLGFGRTRARCMGAEAPKVTFGDVAGADEAKADLSEVVDFLRTPQKYHELGARIPRGILLVGSPGTGKTLLARAVAGEAGVPFCRSSA